VPALRKTQPEILKYDVALGLDCANNDVSLGNNALPFCLLFLSNPQPRDKFLQKVQRIEIVDYILAARANVFG